MMYGDFKVCFFALICLKYVADGQNGTFTNARGYFKSNATVLDLRLNFSSNSSSAFNMTYLNCTSTLRKPNQTSHEMNVSCDEFTKPCLPLSNTGNWINWSTWSECLSSKEQYRYRSLTCPQNQSQCLLSNNGSSFERKNCTFDFGNWINWSTWSECLSSKEQYRYRSLTCPQNQSQCLLSNNGSSFERKNCTFDFGNWSHWSNWSECLSTEEQYRHRLLSCPRNNSDCLLLFNSSSCEKRICTSDLVSSTQGSRQENIKEDEKRYTLTEIILVAFGCLMMGVILTTLLFILYIKRAQQGCFSKNVKEAQVNSNQQSGPDLKLLAENVLSNKYDPNKSESAESKKENKSDETQYQSLCSKQTHNDHETYDELQQKETRSDHHANDHSSGRLKPEIYAEVGDEDSTSETQGEPSDAAHEYFVLEHVENGHNQD